MSYVPPKADPNYKQPTFVGLTPAAVLALRQFYFAAGGDHPITPERIKNLMERMSAAPRQYAHEPGQIIKLLPGETLREAALRASSERPEVEIAVGHMRIRTCRNTDEIILRDARNETGESGAFQASEVAHALERYFWRKF